jgi:prophage antirepressor-like protein
MSNLIPFESSQFGKVRVVMRDETPWFVCKDIATALDYQSPSMTVLFGNVPSQWRSANPISTAFGVKDMLCVNEIMPVFDISGAIRPHVGK